MSESEERPRRKRVERVRVLRLRDEELHHPLHAPYVRDKSWKKEATTDGTDEADEQD